MRFEKEINIYAKDAIIKRFKATETSFDIVNGKISALISESELDELQNGTTTMYSKLADVNLTINGLTKNYSDLYGKYDEVSGQYTEVSGQIASYTESVDEYERTLQTVNDNFTQYESSVKQSAEMLSMMVKSMENESSFELTSAMAKLVAETISLNGNVQVNGDMLVDGAITTQKLASDAIKSLNYSYTSGNFSEAGTFFDLSSGLIRSKNFGIDSNGNAYFKGDITGASGTFTGKVQTVSGTGDLDTKIILDESSIYIKYAKSGGTLLRIFADTEMAYPWIRIKNDYYINIHAKNETEISSDDTVTLNGKQVVASASGSFMIDTPKFEVHNSGTAYVRARCTASEKTVAIASNASGTGGMYDVTNQKWMFYSNSSGTIMSNASDRRVKNDHGIISRHDSLAILRTPIHEFSYIADESGTLQYGIMAQDLRDTLVSKGIGYRSMLQIQVKNSDEITQDLLRDESEVEYGIDYSKIVPVLMDGWQYHDDKIRDLTDQLKQALERIETQEQAIRELSIV
jgi:hypothetical protein